MKTNEGSELRTEIGTCLFRKGRRELTVKGEGDSRQRDIAL